MYLRPSYINVNQILKMKQDYLYAVKEPCKNSKASQIFYNKRKLLKCLSIFKMTVLWFLKQYVHRGMLKTLDYGLSFHINTVKGLLHFPLLLLCSLFSLRIATISSGMNNHTSLYFMSHIQPVRPQARDQELCHWEEKSRSLHYNMDEGTSG